MQFSLTTLSQKMTLLFKLQPKQALSDYNIFGNICYLGIRQQKASSFSHLT